MKRLIVLTFLSTLFICCHGEEVEMPEDVYRKVSKDKTRWVANARGAKATERFCVVDDLGVPVPDASVMGVWGTPSSNAATFEGLTDSKGVFTADGVTRDMVRYIVKTDGFYTSEGEVRYIDTWTVPAVKDGRWQSSNATRRIVLKRMRNIGKLAVPNCRGTIEFDAPVQDEWLPFDLEVFDWNAPYGAGKYPDVLLRFHGRKAAWNDFTSTMEVCFTNNPHAGVYELKKDLFSCFKTVYKADSNAVYRSSLDYKCERTASGQETERMLDRNSYLVFRTRTKIDDKGNLKSAHYGVIQGAWAFDGKSMRFSDACFNSRENDVDVEDGLILRRQQDYETW